MTPQELDVMKEYAMLDNFTQRWRKDINKIDKARFDQDLESIKGKLREVRAFWIVLRDTFALTTGVFAHFDAILESIVVHSEYASVIAIVEKNPISIQVIPELEKMANQRREFLQTRGVL